MWQEISHILWDQSTGAKIKTYLRLINRRLKVFCWCHCLLLNELQETRRWCYQQERVMTYLSTHMNSVQLHDVLIEPEESTKISCALACH